MYIRRKCIIIWVGCCTAILLWKKGRAKQVMKQMCWM